MKIIYDNSLLHRSLTEVLREDNYWHKRFQYRFIYQYHNAETRILSDLDTIPVSRVNFEAKTFVIFRLNCRSKVITISTLEWIITHIAARLILQSEIVWAVENDPAMKKHQLDITLDIPVVDATQTV